MSKLPIILLFFGFVFILSKFLFFFKSKNLEFCWWTLLEDSFPLKLFASEIMKRFYNTKLNSLMFLIFRPFKSN